LKLRIYAFTDNGFWGLKHYFRYGSGITEVRLQTQALHPLQATMAGAQRM
jgi:hypothetical protein